MLGDPGDNTERFNGGATAQRLILTKRAPIRISHDSHDIATKLSHSDNRAGWQGNPASTEIWILRHNVRTPIEGRIKYGGTWHAREQQELSEVTSNSAR